MTVNAPDLHDVMLACYREAGLPEPHRQGDTFLFDTADLWRYPPELLHRAHVVARRAVGREPVALDDWVKYHWQRRECRPWLRHHGHDLAATEPTLEGEA